MALKSNYDHIVEWLLSEHLLPTLRNTDPIFHHLAMGQSLKAVCEHRSQHRSQTSNEPSWEPVARLSAVLKSARRQGGSAAELAEVANSIDFTATRIR